MTTYRPTPEEVREDFYGPDPDHLNCPTSDIIEDYIAGRLVPDTRLQAIADAWNHHKAMEAIGDDEQRPQAFSLLRDLLDALVEDNDE